MASEIDIGNLALAHLGDDATVSSFNPPEGSAQAEHVARFYPIARDSLLEQHEWNFATRRGNLAAVTISDPTGKWAYAYALPANTLKAISVTPPTGGSVLTSDPVTAGYVGSSPASPQVTGYTSQDFVVETDSNGNLILFTNQPSAVVKYIVRVSDTNKYSPLFVDVLSWYLAAYLAGPVLKGEVGRAEAKGCMQLAMVLMGKAILSDTMQRQTRTQVQTPWVNGR